MRKQGVNHILQIFFPKVCPICTEVLDREQEICQDCRKKLKYITEPKCKKCGKPFESVDAQSQIRQYCGDCQKNRHDYEYGMAVFRYNDEIRESIYRFKYKNQRTYAGFYADEMWKVYGRQIRAEGIEVMIPVPVSRKKMQKTIAPQTTKISAILKIGQILKSKKSTTPCSTYRSMPLPMAPEINNAVPTRNDTGPLLTRLR